MKRFIMPLALTFMLVSSVFAQDTLKTGIRWDEEKARTLAIKHLDTEIDVSIFQGVDPGFLENIKALKFPNANTIIANRTVTNYTAGDYSVAYDGENIVNYYRQDGTLIKVSICSSPFGETTDYSNYPRRCVEYDYPNGKIMAVSLDVSPVESFVFLPDGTLKNHWVGNQGFDAQEQELYERQ